MLDQEATCFTVDDIKELIKRKEDEERIIRRQQGSHSCLHLIFSSTVLLRLNARGVY